MMIPKENKMRRLFHSMLALVLVSGCAVHAEHDEPRSDDDKVRKTQSERRYQSTDLGKAREVAHGRIVSLTPVELEESRVEPGTVIGAIAGGLAGRQLGSGSGRDIATIIGAVAGGYAGSRYGDRAAQAEAAEIGIELDDGRSFTVLQEIDEDDVFRVGDRVRVEFDGDLAEVELAD